MLARSVVATLWNAGQSCQPSPSASGCSSMIQNRPRAGGAAPIPIRAISSATISSGRWVDRAMGVGGSSNRAEIPGSPSAVSAGPRGRIGPGARPPTAARSGNRGGAGTPLPGRTGLRERTSGMLGCFSLAQWTSSSRSLVARRWALRRASLSGESSAAVAVAQPAVVIAAQGAAVIFQLYEVQPALVRGPAGRPRATCRWLSRNSKFDQARNGTVPGSSFGQAQSLGLVR